MTKRAEIVENQLARVDDGARLFAELVANLENPSEAYRTAYGASTLSAKEVRYRAIALLNTRQVRREIAEIRADRSTTLMLTPNDVALGLYELATNRSLAPLVRVQAWKQLGRYTGGFGEEINVKGFVQHQVDLSRLTEEELAELDEIVSRAEERPYLQATPATPDLDQYVIELDEDDD